MVFVKKFLTPQQTKESQTTKTCKAKRRMVIGGNFATGHEMLWDSTSTRNVDIGLLRNAPESHQ
eukprot:11825711-Prorocentrum_lima.AAC.1